jgi:membrane dipeptidase
VTEVVDLHSDLLLDVVYRRLKGETEVVRRRHLEPLAAAGVRVQVLAAWTDTEVPLEAALPAALRMFEAARREAEESDGAFRIVTTAAELDAALADGALAGILALEGCEPLGDDPGLIDTFWRLGLRMAGLTWNRPNWFADGTGDTRNAGLTRAGRELVLRMADRGIALDLSHLSRRGCTDALELTTGPVLASHANAAAVYESSRNLTDDVIAELARRGGVVGLNFLPVFLGPGEVSERLADHHAHLVGIGGPDLPACGADLVAFLPQMPPEPLPSHLPPDADAALARLPEPPRERAYADFAQAIRARGTAEPQVAATLAGNSLSFLRRLLG